MVTTIATQITISATVWALTRLPCVVIFAALRHPQTALDQHRPAALRTALFQIRVPLTALRVQKGFLSTGENKGKGKKKKTKRQRTTAPRGLKTPKKESGIKKKWGRTVACIIRILDDGGTASVRGEFSRLEAVRRATLRDRYKRHRRLLVAKSFAPDPSQALHLSRISSPFRSPFNPRPNLPGSQKTTPDSGFVPHFLCRKLDSNTDSPKSSQPLARVFDAKVRLSKKSIRGGEVRGQKELRRASLNDNRKLFRLKRASKMGLCVFFASPETSHVCVSKTISFSPSFFLVGGGEVVGVQDVYFRYNRSRYQ